ARQQTDELDRPRPRLLETLDRGHRRIPGGQHRINHDGIAIAHFARHLEVVLDGGERLGVAVKSDVSDARARDQTKDAVEDAGACAQDRDQHDLLAIEHGNRRARQRRLHRDLMRRHVTRDFVGEQLTHLGQQIAECRRARALHAHEAELVLYQRMIDDVDPACHAISSAQNSVPSLATRIGGAPALRSWASSRPSAQVPPSRILINGSSGGASPRRVATSGARRSRRATVSARHSTTSSESGAYVSVVTPAYRGMRTPRSTNSPPVRHSPTPPHPPHPPPHTPPPPI